MNAVENDSRIANEQFARLGTPRLAYIKTVIVDGEGRYEVHGADGQVLAVMDDRDIAIATVKQHDMVPMSVH